MSQRAVAQRVARWLRGLKSDPMAEYLDVAFSAVERCAASLQRILAQAPDARQRG